jgi:hypothetical protein
MKKEGQSLWNVPTWVKFKPWSEEETTHQSGLQKGRQPIKSTVTLSTKPTLNPSFPLKGILINLSFSLKKTRWHRLGCSVALFFMTLWGDLESCPEDTQAIGGCPHGEKWGGLANKHVCELWSHICSHQLAEAQERPWVRASRLRAPPILTTVSA